MFCNAHCVPPYTHTHTRYSTVRIVGFTTNQCFFILHFCSTDDVRHQPLLRSCCVSWYRPSANRGRGGRAYLGGGPGAGRGLHHMHRHSDPPLQKVRI